MLLLHNCFYKWNWFLKRSLYFQICTLHVCWIIWLKRTINLSYLLSLSTSHVTVLCVALFVCSCQEGIVERLFKWAQEAEQPLRIYATGLLAGAMENQDIAANYREENSVLVSRGSLLLNEKVITRYSIRSKYCLSTDHLNKLIFSRGVYC